jgi:hypothetical protein
MTDPSSIRIQRMLGAGMPARPLPGIPRTGTPSYASRGITKMLMRPMGRAEGGIVDSPSQPFTGGIMSAGAGRADDVKAHVPDGAYVVPAWGVSHMGEGNTVAGMTMLKMMFGSPWGAGKAPYGAPTPKPKMGKGMSIPRPPTMMQKPPWIVPGMEQANPALAQSAHGGAAHAPQGTSAVPVNLSGGEFVIDPDEVAKIGSGDVNKGHLILDKWVMMLKQEAADTIKKLPGPSQ